MFLGHVVGQGEVAPVAAKVAAIFKFPAPTDKREVMRFLGMAGYYCKFCCNFSVVVEPLTSLLRKREKLIWSEECQQAFEKVKSLLFSAPVLRAPDFEIPLNYKLMLVMWGLELCYYKKVHKE